MFISSALIAVLFFGGYNYPGMDWVANTIGANAATILGVGALFTKIIFGIFFYMWIRWTLPRFRYDQLMYLGWRILIPLAIVNIVITGVVLLLVFPR
jgi:NADH-quinone oxidoreductase subunit H